MHWRTQNGIRYLQFPALADSLHFFHAIVLRNANDTEGRPQAFNIGLGCADSDEQVWRNRNRMLELWNNPLGIYTHQVHGVDVSVWSGNNAKQNRNSTVQLNGDALVTDQPDSALVIQVADCQPVILMDPVRQVIANIHSGWRGSIRNIIGNTVKAMGTRFGSLTTDLIAGIGPSLGPCCAEFVNYRTEIPPSLWGYRGVADHFNFWQMSIDQLRQAGLQAQNIKIAGICTKCNSHLFFSYRAEKQTGRFASVVGIKA